MATKVAPQEGLGPRHRVRREGALARGRQQLAFRAPHGGLQGEGDKEKAAEYEKKFIAANPDKPEILYNQAVDLYNKGKFKEAEPILRKILEGGPSTPTPTSSSAWRA